jgi:transcriptional regulator with XRE-family HTH domain
LQQEPQTLAETLLRLRKKQGYSMKTLSAMVGISAAYICKLESGQRKPTRDLVLRFSETLLPTGSEREKDELLLLAGFAPQNYRSFLGRTELVELYEKELESNPLNFKAFIALVMVLVRSGSFKEAELRIQKGLPVYDDQIQLQALLAALELAKENFDTAIEYQLSALNYYNLHQGLTQTLVESDLLLSLGIMYFLKGEALLDLKIQQEAKQESEKAQTTSIEVNIALLNAKENFQKALKTAKDDIYILDEYARVCFSLATLDNQKQTPSEYWQECISSFEQVVTSEQKHCLGSLNLLQSTVFWAFAMAKNQQFTHAWLQLSVIEACVPDFWLLHYVKACYFCLYAQTPDLSTAKQEQQLTFALAALDKAIQIQDTSNSSKSEAKWEPDFAILRQLKSTAFEKLIRE